MSSPHVSLDRAPAIGGTDGLRRRPIKKVTTENAELKKALAVVRGQLTKTKTKLTKANEKTDRWKKEAAAHRTAASRSDARAEKLQHKLDRATAALKPSPATKPPKAAASAGSTNEPSTAYGLTAPDNLDHGPAPRRGPRPRTHRDVGQNERRTARRTHLTSHPASHAARHGIDLPHHWRGESSALRPISPRGAVTDKPL